MSESPERRPDDPERDERTGRSAAQARIRHQSMWVEQQIRRAQERGDFDDLPGAGKPLADLGSEHEPDWWLKRLVEREQVTGVLPPALQLRRDDLELDARLDRISDAEGVRRAVEEFNASVRKALYTPPVGNEVAFPVVTPRRDVDVEVERWQGRREARRAAQREVLARQAREAREARQWDEDAPSRGWLRRRRRRS